MARLSAKLRSVGNGIGWWCPGCDGIHVLHRVNVSEGWTWDGNVEAPTISPSVLVSGGGEGIVCHTFIKAGQIEFLGDCTHALKGRTVPIPDWPYAEGEYGGV